MLSLEVAPSASATRWPAPGEVLAQRPPFLFLDTIEHYERSLLRASKSISSKEPFLGGHFPGFPIVPGVLLIEMMAQAGAALSRLDQGAFVSGRVLAPGKLAVVDDVRFLKSVYPGDRLTIEARVLHKVGDVARIAGRITRGDEELVMGRLTLVSPRYETDNLEA